MLATIKSINYLSFFELRPFTATATLKWYAAAFGMLIIAGIAIGLFQYLTKTDKLRERLLLKYFRFFAVVGSVGAILVWLRYERVQVLAGRFMLAAWVIAAAYWLYAIINYQIKVMPQARKQAEERRLLQKYLPRKK